VPANPNDQPTEDIEPAASGSGGTTERLMRALGGGGESPGDEIGP